MFKNEGLTVLLFVRRIRNHLENPCNAQRNMIYDIFPREASSDNAETGREIFEIAENTKRLLWLGTHCAWTPLYQWLRCIKNGDMVI
jgi:hypothetical protein